MVSLIHEDCSSQCNKMSFRYDADESTGGNSHVCPRDGHSYFRISPSGEVNDSVWLVTILVLVLSLQKQYP